MRDIAFAASGLLNEKVGGPSVYPAAPAFLFLPPSSYGPKTWNEDKGPDRYRRALYTFRFRSVPYPMLQTFDAPNGDFSCVRRVRSNTPLQALVTLNEPMFLEAARAMALRVLKEGGSENSQRLSYAFQLALSRTPQPKEQDVLLTMLEKQKQRLTQGWLSASDLTGYKFDQKAALPANVTPVDWGAWTTAFTRAVEPRRDDYQGVTMNCQDYLYRRLHPKQITRRWFFEQCGVGLGSVALGHLLAKDGYAAPSVDPLAAKQPHFAPKAKRVIFLFMAGAPSHLDLFDNKPRPGEVRRNTSASRTAEGLPSRVHQSEFEAARTEIQVSQSRPERD